MADGIRPIKGTRVQVDLLCVCCTRFGVTIANHLGGPDIGACAYQDVRVWSAL